MNINKLDNLIKESKLSKSEICSKCGFTRPTLDNALSGADVKISTIISLSKFFKVSIGYFFDEEKSIDNDLSNKLEECKEEIQRLNGIIAQSNITEIFNENKSESDAKILLLVEFNKENMIKLNLKDKVLRILNN
jgi:transcriptional regulator with XRE-family HTH domain